MSLQFETASAGYVRAAGLAGAGTDNHLLARMDAEDRATLEMRGKVVRLTSGQVLYEPEDEVLYVHFPRSGAVSLVTTFSDGTGVEGMMVGRDGVLDVMSYAAPVRATARAVVQLPGEALRLEASAFREIVRANPGTRTVLELNAARSLAEVQQSAACNASHRLEPRLAKWLLKAHDRFDTDILPLTQEFLGDMLGAQRTTVTAVASSLQRMGAISYRRGRITVLDRSALERASCECYAASLRRARAASRI
jgi:CRP-like cAMP-binding protein